MSPCLLKSCHDSKGNDQDWGDIRLRCLSKIERISYQKLSIDVYFNSFFQTN